MTESRPNISIIVPVYNVEKYIARCLDSIFNQQFSGAFEVIAVEDGSTDKSLQLLKNYQANQTRLKVIEHGANKKLSVARATGMKAAKGDYIMHVDSDDWLLPNALENLFIKCLDSDADVVVFNYNKQTSEGKTIPTHFVKKEIITQNKILAQPHFLGACWNKIVKSSITKNLISGEVGINTTEDLLYATEILLKANKIYLTQESYYMYFVNTESLSLAISPNLLIARQIVILQQIKLIALKYGATSQFVNNILSYLEKNIFLLTSHVSFLSKQPVTQSTSLLNVFRLFPEMTDKRLRKLSMVMSNKYYSLFQVYLRFGIKPVLGIILRIIRNSAYNF